MSKILTVKEVVQEYKTSATTLWRLEKRGELVPDKKTKGVKGRTGKRFYSRDTLDKFFNLA